VHYCSACIVAGLDINVAVLPCNAPARTSYLQYLSLAEVYRWNCPQHVVIIVDCRRIRSCVLVVRGSKQRAQLARQNEIQISERMRPEQCKKNGRNPSQTGQRLHVLSEIVLCRDDCTGVLDKAPRSRRLGWLPRGLFGCSILCGGRCYG
jgi:hypothetical protein